MKTIEEKAKAYDEALSKAKEQYNYPCMRSCMGILEEIFPELAESEDEKIKNRLTKLIKMSNEVGGFALHKWEADEMLTWLDKQGEKKSVEENKGNIGGISSNWSEEDEQYVKDTLALIGFGLSTHSIGQVQEWLQSLQDRVQPQKHLTSEHYMKT